MELKNFLCQLLSMHLTINELSVFLELGYSDFSRDDLLTNTNRCPIDTYSPSALTRVMQNLLTKFPTEITTYLNSSNNKTYRLVNRCNTFSCDEPILLSLARSRVLTVNTMRVALEMLTTDNKQASTRFLANCLDLTPDYLASTVIPRMIVIGLLKTELIDASPSKTEANFTEKDKFPLHLVKLNVEWKGTSEISLL